MLEILKQQIMNDNRHSFIYGYDKEERKNFLKELEQEYPLQKDCNKPIAVYLEEIGFPKEEITNGLYPQQQMVGISSEYLALSIADTILNKTMEAMSQDELEEKCKPLLERLNRRQLNLGVAPIQTTEELELLIKKSKEKYLDYYQESIQNKDAKFRIQDVPIPFLSLDFFISSMKKAINYSSSFKIIIDRQKSLALSSYQAVNFLIGRRNNTNISLKVATSPTTWETYSDANGQAIEYLHDYEVVEFDDSYRQYIKRQKERYRIFNED